jgi:hypothetical protein
MHGLRAADPLRRLAGFEPLCDRRVRDAQHGARTVEIGRANDCAAELAALHLVHQHRRDASADFAFPAAGVVGRLLGHHAVQAPIRVDVIEEDERAAVTFARIDGAAHHSRPLLLPYLAVVLQSGDQIGDLAAGDCVRGRLRVEQIGTEYLVCSVHRLR